MTAIPAALVAPGTSATANGRGTSSAACRVDSAFYRGTAVLHVQGELVLATAAALRVELAAAVGHRRVLVELSGVSFIDAAGLGALIGAIRRVNEARGTVALTGAPPTIAAVLRAADVEHVAHLAESPAEAVAWLGVQAGPDEDLTLLDAIGGL